MNTLLKFLLCIGLLGCAALHYGCTPKTFTESSVLKAKDWYPTTLFLLDGTLAQVQAAVIGAYSDWLIAVEEAKSKDGELFSLINQKDLSLTDKQAADWADCGYVETEEYEKDYVTTDGGIAWRYRKKTITLQNRPIPAKHLSFNVFLTQETKNEPVTMRVRAVFTPSDVFTQKYRIVCTSRGTFEQLLYSKTEYYLSNL